MIVSLGDPRSRLAGGIVTCAGGLPSGSRSTFHSQAADTPLIALPGGTSSDAASHHAR
ncbi:hypothetical protein [Catenuloplanes indicus]|uniref:Uncharacterized protein n=1 Tax=Catenuloplanes indicus TaxID=137267 RepID=A0AAE3W6Q2_9ACTN|nr:hypothetical protein [Catenuloplanes indicus]MDQ0369644.1 hypothetical protein [Catenuloplanes indicus]